MQFGAQLFYVTLSELRYFTLALPYVEILIHFPLCTKNIHARAFVSCVYGSVEHKHRRRPQMIAACLSLLGKFKVHTNNNFFNSIISLDKVPKVPTEC